MNWCGNCGSGLDTIRTKIYHRETYHCQTDETGRISVACSTIRCLKDEIERLKAERQPQYGESFPDDEGL